MKKILSVILLASVFVAGAAMSAKKITPSEARAPKTCNDCPPQWLCGISSTGEVVCFHLPPHGGTW